MQCNWGREEKSQQVLLALFIFETCTREIEQLQHGTACPGKQELRYEADHHRRHSRCDCGEIEEGLTLGLRVAIAHVHDHDHTQVVVCRDQGGEHADDRQTVKPPVDHSAEQID